MSAPINILVIHADQHRWDCMGNSGNPSIRTPNLDRLAADGVRYENSFCTYPVCTPSRYSLLSGQYVWEHRGWSNHCTLASHIPTFPKELRKNGYRTAAVGKMHFTPTYLDVGFDDLRLAEQDGNGRWDDDYHRELMDKGLVDLIDIEDQRQEYRKHAPQEYWDSFGAQACDLPEELHTTSWTGDRALEQIDAWDDSGGSLLMVGFVKPHHPFDPPQRWLDMYDPAQLTPPAGWTESVMERNQQNHQGYFPHRNLTRESLQQVTAAYYATISHLDHHVGRMIDELKRRDLYHNTMIVYTADHGDYMGHQHMILKGNHMYDPLMRVPLLIKYPRGLNTGQSHDGQVNALDVTRTILSQAGLDIPASMSGADLSQSGVDHEYVFAEGWCGRQTMVRTKQRKLLLDKEYAPELLFDLENDPHELNDLSADPAYADDIKELTAVARSHRGPEDVRDTYLNYDEQTITGPNVPSDLSHRPAIERYYAKKASEVRGVNPEQYLHPA